MSPVFSFRNTTILLCGAGGTALGVFRRHGRDFRCLHFAAETWSIGPVGEDRWREQTVKAMIALNATRQWTGPAVLVLPPHLTLIKQIKVPRVEAAKRTQVIRFEAEEAIPHSLAEVVWDCVPSGQRDTEENLLLVAAKRDLVSELCAAAHAAGFAPERILPHALVTLATFRLFGPAEPPPTVILNLDGRSTTLLLVDGARFAVRTLALGGATLTPPARETPDGAAEAPDPFGQDVAVQAFASRLALEINRSIQHFGGEGGLAQPVRAFLTGGAAAMGGFDAILAARLKIPLERLDRPTVGEGSTGVALSGAPSASLADLRGAAALMLSPAQPTVDLLPPALRQRANFRRRQPWFAAATLLATAALIPPILHYRQVTATVRAKSAALEKNLAPLRDRESRLRTNVNRLRQVQVQIAQLQSVHERRTSWLQWFSGVEERLVRVEDAWFEEMRLIPPAAGRPMKLAVSGRILDRGNPAAPDQPAANRRLKVLLAALAELPQVASIEGERFDHSEPGLLRFEFIILPPAVPSLWP